MSCIPKLTANISYDTCNPNLKPAIGGLDGGKAYLVNRADIDFTSLTNSGATVTNFNVNSGSSIYEIAFLKQLSNTESEFKVNDNGLDKYLHSFAGRIYTTSAVDAERIKELGEGEFMVIVETKYKGDSSLAAFKMYGLENGLKMKEGKQTSLENDGSFVFKLSSLDNFGESYPYKVYLETSYAATKAKLASLVD